MPNSRSRTFERLGDARLAGASLEGQTALRLGEVTKEIGDGASVGTGNGEVGIGGGVEIGVQGAPLLTGIPGIAQFVHVGRATALADIVVAHAGDAELTVTLEVLDGLGRVGGVLGGLTDGDDGAPGIQLSGTAAEISAALAKATFTADGVGQGHLRITADDGQMSAISHYAFTAVKPPINTAPTFAVPTGTGKLMVPVGSGSDSGKSVTLQPDGKIVVAGFSDNGINKYDFTLIRLNVDGSLDGGFGEGGKKLLDVGGADDFGQSVALQPDGKIVVAGESDNGINKKDFSLIRLNADGSLDEGFGEGGKKLLNVGRGDDAGQSVTVQPDGKIVVAGFSDNGINKDDFSLIRLNADGSLDEGFGDVGKQLLDVGSSTDYGLSVALQPDGKIVVAGFSDNGINKNDFSLIRLNADGSLDEGFGQGGKQLLDVGRGVDAGQSVTVQPDGKIMVAGYSGDGSGIHYDFSLIRLNANGSLDTGFGSNGNGTMLLPLGNGADRGNSVTLQSDGKIVLAGYSLNGNNDDFSLIRLNANGSLDEGFGGNGNGKMLVSVGKGDDRGFSVSLQPDGKIMVAGNSYNGDGKQDFSLIRLNADGSLDTTFNTSTPPVDTLGDPVSYTQNRAPVVLDSAVAVFDAELAAQGHYAGASLTLARNGGAHAQDMFGASGALELTDDGGVELSGIRIGSHSQVEGQLAVTFNAQATQARVNQALSSLTYANTSDAPPESVTIDWRFNDGSGDAAAASGSTLVDVAPANDAPVLTGIPGVAQFMHVGQATALADIVVDYVDDAELTVTLELLDGLGRVGGVLGGLSDGDDNAPGIQLTGTAEEISAALAEATFTANALGQGHLKIMATDGYKTATSHYAFTAVTAPVNTAPTFAVPTGSGKLVMRDDNLYSNALSVALQPDGKIVVAGSSVKDSKSDFSLARLNSDGSLDGDFGIDGQLLEDIDGLNDQGYSVIVQLDGKIVAAGSSIDNGSFYFSLIRLNVDGSRDEGFGEGGKKLLDVGGAGDYGQSVALQPDGKIVVAGYSYKGGIYDFSLIRLNVDGSLDEGFGEGGKKLLDVGGAHDYGQSVALQPDGKIVVAGYSVYASGDHDFSLIRLDAHGNLDQGFGEAGKLLLDMGSKYDYGQSVTLQSDGKIVVAGYSLDAGFNADFSLIRLNADGSLDTTFNPSTIPVDTLGGTASYSKNGLPVVLDSEVSVFDAELAAQGHYAGASLTLARNGGAHAQDRFGASGALVLTDDGGVELSGIRIGSYSQVEGQLAVTFNTQATQARVNQALSSLTYANTSDAPPASVSIDWSFNDGSGDMPPASGSTLVSIAPVNDAPMLAGVPAQAEGVTVGQPAALADFTVSDNDGDDMTLTLTAVNGTLKGLDDSDPDADGIQLSGTAAQINAAIAGATFTAAAAGAASIELELSDGAESVTQRYLLTATAPPRPPAPQPPAPQPPAPQPPAPPPAPPVPPPATPGIDVVHYPGARDDYVLQRNDADLWSLRTASGSKATPLPGIERLVFDDGAVALDLAVEGTDATAAQAARLVFALWGQAGLDSPALVGHVMAYVDSLGLGAASQVAENLGLLTALAGDAEPAALLTLLYTHIVGHAPDPAQLQALMELPASGHSNAQLLQMAAELAVTAQAMDLDALARKGLEFTPYDGPMLGSGGNEVFLAQQGDDRIDAGAGLDTVVYVGNAADYAWSRGDQGQWVVKSSAHDGGRDPLQGVERLRFADHAVALDLEGAAGQALRMLGAVLGAQALDDRVLVGELIAYVDAYGAQALADGVQANGILDRLAGGDSPQALITLLYQNVMQHAPDQAELEWALDLAAQQDWDRADLLLQVAALPQAAQLIDLDGLANQGVAYAVWELERAPV